MFKKIDSFTYFQKLRKLEKYFEMFENLEICVNSLKFFEIFVIYES